MERVLDTKSNSSIHLHNIANDLSSDVNFIYSNNKII